MARGETGTAITQSVLDRLIDREPDSQTERPPTRAQSVRQLKAAVRRDLEWLLNTRRNPEAAPDAASELAHSLYVYGLPDITSFSLNSTKDQNRLAWLLENAIKEFEPRLKAVRVRMETPGSGLRALRFQIEGMLAMDPVPERVTFDTLLELTSGSYRVKGEPGA